VPSVGGSGTGLIGLARARVPSVGGSGTGLIGLATARVPSVGGSGTGLIGLAVAKELDAVKITKMAARRKFNKEEFIWIVLLNVKRS
jgi:hypothetical protein